ncbi:MAG: PTS ascorbate transporter subunit IIC, partial [Lachnospiraceae bacterium]|nr:PTS ascorbate transporter subunit IIC [Lachnospiraceae bacterium]
MVVLEFIKSLLTQPAWIMGIISCVGLIALKKPFHKVLVGTLTPIMGYLMLSAGAGVVDTNLAPLSAMLQVGFHIEGIVPSNEAVISVAQSILGVETMAILILGYLINLAVARLTRFKYIFLTGHHSLIMACLLCAVLQVSGFSGTGLVVIGGMFLGFLSAML